MYSVLNPLSASDSSVSCRAMFLKGKGKGNGRNQEESEEGKKRKRIKLIVCLSTKKFHERRSVERPPAEAHKFHGEQSKAVDCIGEELRAFELQKIL